MTKLDLKVIRAECASASLGPHDSWCRREYPNKNLDAQCSCNYINAFYLLTKDVPAILDRLESAEKVIEAARRFFDGAKFSSPVQDAIDAYDQLMEGK